MKELSQGALDVLGSLAIDGTEVRITTQLDRKLYVEVNAALETIGGKWNRKAKAHVFPGDPADALDQILVDGGFHDKKRDLDQFFTPPALAKAIVERADVRGRTVLEPSAGLGAIVDECAKQGAKEIVCVDKDPGCIRELRSIHPYKSHIAVFEGDFLEIYPFTMRVDRVVMNPPFSKQQDIAHVTHALAPLAPGGRLVAIMSAGVTFRDDKKTRGFRALVDKYGTIEPLPAGSFRESKTDVRTVVVTLEKPV